ncbi:intermembrane lipid transfer protein Vps13D [Bacillus rossius redtenbacheri]|uniref:intermembrane lipid transfer protein Vps13D n=1 Tax=Bacillus rossius redtenbacheri TaxID=93214 RepID=UPI002FDE5F8E
MVLFDVFSGSVTCTCLCYYEVKESKMLERLVAWVLNNYLGKYVENLNTAQLSIEVLQGEVELENLPLKKDALRHVGLPVQLLSGNIGKVKLQIPVSQLRSAPWVILVERVCLVVGPIRLDEWDWEAEERAANEYKLYQLDSLEAQLRAELESSQVSNSYATNYSGWLSMGTNLVTSIVENLQLKIRDVHMRYEDREAGGQAFALGVTMGALSAQSCDDTWAPRFVGPEMGEASFKLLELSGLAVYCDLVGPDELLGCLSHAELVEAMRDCIALDHSFLLSPVSAQARLKRNKSNQPLRSKTKPRVVCDVEFQEVPLSLTDRQYGRLVGCVKGLLRAESGRRRRGWRPARPPAECPRAWWGYAARCSVPGWRPRPAVRSWEQALARARDNVAYVGACAGLLASPAATLAPEARLLKEAVEAERGYEELRALREVALRKVQAQRSAPAPGAGRGTLLQWFPQLWGWSNTAAPPGPDPLAGKEAEIEEEILDVLADSMENNTLLRRDTVFGQFNLTLRKGTFHLCTVREGGEGDAGRVKPVISLEFEDMGVGWESRPRSGSHKFSLVLGGIFLRDQLTRDTAFPVLVGPQQLETSVFPARFRVPRSAGQPGRSSPDKPLFSLLYEYKPFSSAKEYRLQVGTQSLEVVYNVSALEWLTDFFTRPHQTPDAELRRAARHRYEAMKQKTKEELKKNWDQIIQGGLNDRKTWDIELDISAPQIIFVENFCDKNSLIVVVDFGRFHFSNQPESELQQEAPTQEKVSDDEDDFQTPCSTPPGSEASLSESQTMTNITSLSAKSNNATSCVTNVTLHEKLYDRYAIELSELQVLVGRVKDNWKYAHMRGTSALHLLDRFSISLRLERCLVPTADPDFPSLTLAGNLPKLVVHLNEQKILALRTMAGLVAARGLPSPLRTVEPCVPQRDLPPDAETAAGAESGSGDYRDGIWEKSRLLILQFTVDHLSLEVQSRGRSVAELQVSGARASYTKHPFNTSVCLSVHSLLLVDALQTFGPDFELLVASHKHVSMDSVSGSLRDSEPTSPTSPASPDAAAARAAKVTSPVAISQALSHLQTERHGASFRAVSPTMSPLHPTSPHGMGLAPSISLDAADSEALITVELEIIRSPDDRSAEDVQVAAIQFNSLDVIANQETVVELIGFLQRVSPLVKAAPRKHLQPSQPADQAASMASESQATSGLQTPSAATRLEVTFDFHRLNVLLLRAVFKDGIVVGRKIGTATMSDARIHATVGEEVVAQGSLGGLQVLDLTPECRRHQRILSLGKDPLAERDLNAELYALGQHGSPAGGQREAFSFTVRRSLVSESDIPEIKLRMASVWYTHSGLFINELQSCASEFKQYLANLARSIKTAATEMALGLVHARAEALAQSLHRSSRLATPLAGDRRRSWSLSWEPQEGAASSTRNNTPHAPSSPGAEEELLHLSHFRLDLELATPVVVLPRSATSAQVLVAHLGKIRVSNCLPSSPGCEEPWSLQRHQRYSVEVRDMNLFSLDTLLNAAPAQSQPAAESAPVPAERLYSCVRHGKPVLHDTEVQLVVDRAVGHGVPGVLLGGDYLDAEQEETLQVSGGVVSALKVSLSRRQYEQLLDTACTLLAEVCPPAEALVSGERRLEGIREEGEASEPVRDPGLLARHRFSVRVLFELPKLTVELRSDVGRGEQGLVDLTLQDFRVQYDKSHQHETNIQISLHSLLMEDLLRERDSRHRYIVVSAVAAPERRAGAVVSASCPDLACHRPACQLRGSLPDHLGAHAAGRASKVEYPCTPPPSPRPASSPFSLTREDNLVHVDVMLVDRSAPTFASQYNSVYRSVNVNFNSLDVIVNVESWVVVLDFFGFGSASGGAEDVGQQRQAAVQETYDLGAGANSELEVQVRSLTLVLNEPEHEVARANVSHLSMHVSSRRRGQTVAGRLGSMSLLDLTPRGRRYREKFLSSGDQVLHFTMVSYYPDEKSPEPPCDMQLKIEMSSVLYVHTKRFVAEIHEFFYRFHQLQEVVESIRLATSIGYEPRNRRSTRLLVELQAGSPVILLPVSSESPDMLVVDLGRLSVSNSFQPAGALPAQHGGPLLDVMLVELLDMDLYAGRSEPKPEQPCCGLQLGGSCVSKQGPSLLREKCRLLLQVDRNLDTHLVRPVPDLSVKGVLSTLHGALDLSQYQLIRGLLAGNLAEPLDDLRSSRAVDNHSPSKQVGAFGQVWTHFSLQLDLLNVTLKLQVSHSTNSPLACINFIKSRLLLETFSNGTQDVDLVSQEILVADTRFQAEPVNKRSNVFTNILQPINMSFEGDRVQAEVHHRSKPGHSKFTILLNNMRLMAILDWWEAVKSFVLGVQPCQSVDGDGNGNAASHSEEGASGTDSELPLVAQAAPPTEPQEVVSIEMNLNITDSEVVVIEDTSQWDSNAVILKSTTVVSYQPHVADKPLSCNLNHCEMFSCVLGMEDETALSIIDPVTVNMEVARRQGDGDRVLEVQMQHLSVRLSYHDMRMFVQIMNSLSKQTSWLQRQDSQQETRPTNIQHQVDKLSALGFHPDDCAVALQRCEGQLDDAALWLTQHVNASGTHQGCSSEENTSTLSFDVIEVHIGCLSVCVIDDCRDADVPLIELSLYDLLLRRELRNGIGMAQCMFSSDYYNRMLSGWEPFTEPWRCEVEWRNDVQAEGKNRTQLSLTAQDILNVNITSTLVDLYKNVKENWTQDSLSYRDRSDGCDMGKVVTSPPGYRRRSPFVPFALRNNTGCKLWFATLIKSTDSAYETSQEQDALLERNEKWTLVSPSEAVPFTFEGRGKARHQDTHKLRLHQLSVQVEGWCAVAPVSVDKVGVYFRQANPEDQFNTHVSGPVRIVFEVTLEGSARKLVTVRSALLVCNQLEDSVEIKLDTSSMLGLSRGTRLMSVPPGATAPVPLSHVAATVLVRPQPLGQGYVFCNKPVLWAQAQRPGEVLQEVMQCRSNRDHKYRFCTAIRRENYPPDRISHQKGGTLLLQPAHTITLLPPISVTNLLPCELHYAVKELGGQSGRVRPGTAASLHQVDPETAVELSFRLESFPQAGCLLVPPGAAGCQAVLRLHDAVGRSLLLQCRVAVAQGAGIKISVSAPFWIVNKTALPLVFRQEGVPDTAAGQFEEHELARMVAPLLFSFSDNEASPTLTMRVGNRLHSEGIPQFCQQFHLQKGVQVRRLRVSLRDSRPDVMYEVGVDVRPGRGRYRGTNIVTLSPKHQLHNRCSYQLQFAQRCFATTLTDPGAQATFLTAVPGCCLAFHWPRIDKDQQLCLRLVDVPGCLWSGGFVINANDSRHIIVRDGSGRMYFLRVEIVLQGATYFIVFTDADSIPPPIRIDNYSEVPLHFYQSCVATESLHAVVRPHTSVPYAWDEPTQAHAVTLVAPGGVSAQYDLTHLEQSGDTWEGASLTYENFIYIAFTATFRRLQEDGDVRWSPLELESQQLVLEVPAGCSWVVLARKVPGARSQLWRMSGEGQLQHEGSSPPRDPRSRHPARSDVMVLDIAGPAPQPMQYLNLVLRRKDQRRASTQTWHFSPDGRLRCLHNNMCVQAKDGFFGLREGSEAVLGPPQPVCHQLTGGVPVEQAVSRQKLRPGSGFLAVRLTTDGPTSVLRVSDLKEKTMYLVTEDRDWGNISTAQMPPLVQEGVAKPTPQDAREVQVTVDLPCGVGVSLVSRRPPEELLFAHLTGISLELSCSAAAQRVSLAVQDLQVDNQLLEGACPVVLHVTPCSAKGTEQPGRHALSLAAERSLAGRTPTCDNFKYLIISMKNLTITIEELLLLKLFAFAGFNHLSPEQMDVDENDFEVQRILAEVTSVHAKKYYFGTLELRPGQVRLSVVTTNKLPVQLQSIKRKLGLTLIKFEDASVTLKPFVKNHPFESLQFLLHAILKKYKDELKWQAAVILGSVDFLGNPLGLLGDVAEGFSGLIYDGNIESLVQNVSYGISNSAAKVTESLSDGLGRMIMDEQHEEMRQKIRKVQVGSSGDHLVAGFKGLGFGLLGGVSSIVKQTYEGASADGWSGLISGFGKGLVGTVTKPVVGILDLASETASAVRDSSRSAKHVVPARFRPPRCVTGPGGLLPPYSKKQAQGQEFLYVINNQDYSELLMAYECLLGGAEDLRVLVSSERVRVFTVTAAGACSVVLEAPLDKLLHCRAVAGPRHYIELARRLEPAGHERLRRPRVRCESLPLAQWVSQQINYAKGMYEERRNTLISSSDTVLED